MTASLINKGQTVDKTTEAFRLLQKHGISPMPMMMHHDTQPLYTRGSPYGLLNQVRLLHKAGGDQPAGPDDHTCARVEAVRRSVHIEAHVRPR